jgi:uncharacterized protein (TIGR03437 family)
MKIPVVSRLCGGGLLLLLAGFPVAYGQQYTISTVAGGAPPPTPAAALSTTLGKPNRVLVDSKGNVYFTAGNSVFMLSGASLALVAGNSRPGYSGDGGPAVNAQLNMPAGLALDKAGNLYVADSLNNRVRVVAPSGIINTFAGTGLPGSVGFFGDGGLAAQAFLFMPQGVAVDSSGNVYIADTANNMIRKVTTDGFITTIAGDSLAGFSGDTFLALNAEVNHPADVAVDSQGNVYIADTGNALIRRITNDGNINTCAGSSSQIGYSGDGKAATLAGLIEPYAIAVNAAGDFFIVERQDARIRLVDAAKGNINTVVGNGSLGFKGDGSAANAAILNQPTGIALDPSGNLYIADSENYRIRKAASGGGSGAISTIAGNGGVSYSGDGGQATKAQLNSPLGVAADSSGNLYIADTANNVVRKVTAAGAISTLAGNGTLGSGGDGSAATSAQLNAPQGVAVDASGSVYIADTGNARIRKVSTTGAISTYAGSGTAGFAGDGAAATSAQLNLPIGLAFDSAGNLFIADYGNNVVRKVAAAGGVITTVAGNTVQSYGGDGQAATKASLNGPQAVAVDNGGNLYIADSQNNRIRVVTPAGSISTVAGTGLPGYTGDGHQATSAQIVSPSGLAVDYSGAVYITDSSSLVRRFVVGGPIFTIAGNGTQGYSGDGGPAISAQLNAPMGLAVDSKGVLYVADAANNSIRSLQAAGFASSIAAVVSAASNQTGAVAPGEMLVLYGSGLGPSGPAVSAAYGSNGMLPLSVAGTSVYFNGVPGRVFYSSATQVSAIVPFGVSSGNLAIYVSYQGQTSAPATVTVAAAAPALFTMDYSGKGQAVAVNVSDSSLNGAAHPAKAGAFVLLYATGLGQTNPGGVDGLLDSPPYPLPVLPVTATIGGKTATVQYAGGAQSLVAGIFQINLQIPSGLTPGANAVVLAAGGVSSPAGVTIVTGN